MRLQTRHLSPFDASRRCRAFTLAEVLAALAFMAIVIPVAVEGLRVANLAGQVGERKAIAARIADSVLNEWALSGQTQSSSHKGSVREGVQDYVWSVRSEPWNQDTMRLATVEVIYTVQGREYEVLLSTLIDSSTR
jgi:type II secretory pathway pseudopilin PulG